MATQHRDETLRLCDVIDENGTLSGQYDNCTLLGPAVVLLNQSIFSDNKVMGSLNAVLWEIADDRPEVVGAISAQDCAFKGCIFVNVGFAGQAGYLEQMRRSFT